MKKLSKEDLDFIESIVSKDYARHYFIALGLKRGFETYKAIYIHGQNLLFHRASGNLQLVRLEKDIAEIKHLIHNLSFKRLIGPKSTCHDLGLKVVKEGAFIAELKYDDYIGLVSDAQEISTHDLVDIEALYEKVFPGYPKVEYMTEKLLAKRGIGFMVKTDRILSVAQSDFDRLIVGVATDPDYLRQGYAERCMHALIQEMFKTQSSVYLQYDSALAGKLYEKLGFKVIDQVMHYER